MHVVVVGAGIIGLSSAIALQSAGYNVTIVAELTGSETTSAKAGGKIEFEFNCSNNRILKDQNSGIWIPYHADPREKVLRWSLKTHEKYVHQVGFLLTQIRFKLHQMLTIPKKSKEIPSLVRIVKGGWLSDSPLCEEMVITIHVAFYE